ncbi:DUF2061 domain-containing protein [Leptobacterium flavescens]|uniref:DUF2061 domain-containing protein n=1 Tax=Leptobacterium flavescens TaxID=472055 RepID=A0A6P0UT94_9FLAO|nr:DUF2061 domain-containing protein [Leptobacterium flavescens]NER15218.1 DUF2061 domain-containing protein [Leptobacterium flavescens]
MIIDLFRSEKLKTKPDSHKVSILKAISWRIIGTLDTMLISYVLTGDLKVAFGIGSIEVVSKMLLYYLHERAWTKITKTNEAEYSKDK